MRNFKEARNRPKGETLNPQQKPILRAVDTPTDNRGNQTFNGQINSHEHIQRLHYKCLSHSFAHKNRPCDLCEPSGRETKNIVCSKCVATIGVLSLNERHWLWYQLDANHQRVFESCFQLYINDPLPALVTGIDDRVDLRQIRKQNGLTQTQLAKLLGTTQSFVAKMETGKRSLPRAYLPLIRKLQYDLSTNRGS